MFLASVSDLSLDSSDLSPDPSDLTRPAISDLTLSINGEGVYSPALRANEE